MPAHTAAPTIGKGGDRRALKSKRDAALEKVKTMLLGATQHAIFRHSGENAREASALIVAKGVAQAANIRESAAICCAMR